MSNVHPQKFLGGAEVVQRQRQKYKNDVKNKSSYLNKNPNDNPKQPNKPKCNPKEIHKLAKPFQKKCKRTNTQCEPKSTPGRLDIVPPLRAA